MIPLINNPTRITRKTATLIDNIFTNDLKHTIDSGAIIEDISDHLPIFAICNLEIPKYLENSSSNNLITETTLRTLKHKLQNHDWSRVHENVNVNDAYGIFINDFLELYEESCPKKDFKKKRESINHG